MTDRSTAAKRRPDRSNSFRDPGPAVSTSGSVRRDAQTIMNASRSRISSRAVARAASQGIATGEPTARRVADRPFAERDATEKDELGGQESRSARGDLSPFDPGNSRIHREPPVRKPRPSMLPGREERESPRCDGDVPELPRRGDHETLHRDIRGRVALDRLPHGRSTRPRPGSIPSRRCRSGGRGGLRPARRRGRPLPKPGRDGARTS